MLYVFPCSCKQNRKWKYLSTRQNKECGESQYLFLSPCFLFGIQENNKETGRNFFFKGVAERMERDGQTAEKQIQCGICQRFTMKQKRPLHARNQQRVRAKQWPLTHRWQKQAPALCTDYCPYLCVFHSEAEWEAEFAYRQVMILSKTTRLDYTAYKHWVRSEHWAVGCCQRTTQAWAIRWIPATDAVVLL